jgi:hypothetical protein
MMAQNDVSTAARPSHLAAAKRAKRQAEHLKRVDAMEPIDWQDKHDPSEKIMVTHSIGTKIVEDGNRGHVVVDVKRHEQGRQRIVDARLATSLGGDRLDAMEEIYAGFSALISGLGMKPASVERASKSNGGISDGQAALATDYNRWIEYVDNALFLDQDRDINRHGKPMTFGKGKGANRWTLERLSPEAATSIICHGKTVCDVSAERGKRKEWVRDNLKQAVDVWLCMKNRQEWPEYGIEDDTAPLTQKQVLVRQLNRKVHRVRHADASEVVRVIRVR